MVIFQLINNIALDKKGGGAESFAIRLTNELNKSNTCHLIVVWKYGTLEEQRIIDSLREKDRIHFLSENTKMHAIKFFYLWKKLSSLVKEFSPTIINSHSALPDLLNCTTFFLRKKTNQQIVRTMHTDKNWINNTLLEKFFINCVFPIFFNCEISISKATKARLDDRFISKIKRDFSPVIYNGVSDNVSNYVKPRDSSQKNDTSIIQIVSIGRLAEQKGYKYLLAAMKILEEKKMVNLIIVGEGPLRHELEEQVRLLRLEEKISFLGFRKDALEIMAAADIFVSSSLWEGFSTVILEAMTIGIPVIATDISGTNELIVDRETGILVPVETPVAIAEAIILLLTTPKLAVQVVKNAQKSVIPYSMRAVASAYIKLYEKLVLSIKG